jgi:hypothetical protein
VIGFFIYFQETNDRRGDTLELEKSAGVLDRVSDRT